MPDDSARLWNELDTVRKRAHDLSGLIQQVLIEQVELRDELEDVCRWRDRVEPGIVGMIDERRIAAGVAQHLTDRGTRRWTTWQRLVAVAVVVPPWATLALVALRG